MTHSVPGYTVLPLTQTLYVTTSACFHLFWPQSCLPSTLLLLSHSSTFLPFGLLIKHGMQKMGSRLTCSTNLLSWESYYSFPLRNVYDCLTSKTLCKTLSVLHEAILPHYFNDHYLFPSAKLLVPKQIIRCLTSFAPHSDTLPSLLFFHPHPNHIYFLGSRILASFPMFSKYFYSSSEQYNSFIDLR